VAVESKSPVAAWRLHRRERGLPAFRAVMGLPDSLFAACQSFQQLDWPALAAVMRQPAWLFDACAVADAAAARAAGLRVWVVGEGEG